MWDKFTWEKYPQNTETIVSYRVHPTLFNNGSVYSQHGDLRKFYPGFSIIA
jgi:hypothetical protein